MTWFRCSIVVMCVLVGLQACKSHRPLVESRIVETHDHVVSDSEYWEIVEDTVYALPSALIRGDSVAIPPSPPAPSFHYVLLSQSPAPSVPSLVPVAARKIVKRGAVADSVRAVSSVTEVKKPPNLDVYGNKIRLWKWGCVILFVILCCITYVLIRKI